MKKVKDNIANYIEKPHYTYIDLDNSEVQTNLSKEHVIRILKEYDSDVLIDEIENGTIIVLKHTEKNSIDISDDINFTPLIP